MKDTDEQPNEHGRDVGEVWSTGASVLGSWGVSPSYVDASTDWEAPQTPPFGGFMETPFPALLPSLEDVGAGGLAENVKILILAWPAG